MQEADGPADLEAVAAVGEGGPAAGQGFVHAVATQKGMEGQIAQPQERCRVVHAAAEVHLGGQAAACQACNGSFTDVPSGYSAHSCGFESRFNFVLPRLLF